MARRDVAQLSAPADAASSRARRAAAPLLLLAILVSGFLVAEPITIGSDSMAPTLETGQRVVIDKLSYRFHKPHRGDVAAFRAPGSGDLTVKRVVGIGGDHVAIKDGVLWVNRHPVREPYVDHARVDSVYFGPVQIPRDTVFLMGDNRGDSIDSRTFGPVATSDVVGRVLGQ